MPFKVTTQHYDIKPGTILFKVGISEPETFMFGVDYYLVTEIEGDTSEGAFRTIPAAKLEEV